MVKLLMNNKQLDDLIHAIENSSEYQSYLEICKAIEQDDEICYLVKEIKKLQQEIVKLEYCNDFDCMEMENDLEKKKERLYSIPMYQEYVKRMDILNDILAESTFQIEKYINSKV